jgi:drug/metabolite transporter (DMT)-like permease
LSSVPASDPASARTLGLTLALAAAPAFGIGAILSKIALNDGASPLGALIVRFGLAAVLLIAIAVLLGRRWPRGRMLPTLLVLGAVGQGGMAYCFFSALEHASAGLTTLLLYLHPVFIVAGEVLLGWARWRPVKVAAVLLAVIGCALTIGGGDGDAIGIAWGIGSALTLAAYMLALRRYARDVDPYTSTATLIAGVAIVFAVAAAFVQPTLPQTATGWAAIVGVAIVTTVIAKLMFIGALSRLPASDVSTLMTIEPVFTLIAGAVALGEAVGPAQVAGAVLIVASVIVLARQVRAGTARSGP